VSSLATTHMKQEIGAPVDDFTLTAVGGEPVSLQAFLRGRLGAVVVFWSGVCSHCVRYDGYLNSFAARRPALALIGIASRQGETESHIRSTMAERRLTFPVLHDPGSHVAKAWYTQQTPRAFLIDSNRVLLYRGAIDNFKYPEDPEHAPYLEPAIDQFLAGQPITRSETASFGCAIQSIYYILPKAL
jgi:peroxiredoxin